MPYRQHLSWILLVTVVVSGRIFEIASYGAEGSDGKLFTQLPEVAPIAGLHSTDKDEGAANKKAMAEGPVPVWIWGADKDQKYVARKSVEGTAHSARWRATCDNSMVLYVNGRKVASSDSFETPVEIDVKQYLTNGLNVFEAEIANTGGPAGFVGKLVLTDAKGKTQYVVTDESWQVGDSRDAKEFVAATVVSKLEGHPGGKAFLREAEEESSRDTFNVLPGFQVERLFTVPKDELGSWVNITTDNKGRLIVSDQQQKGLCRVTPSPIGSQEPTQVERLDAKIDDKLISGAQGLLWAFDSLYVVCNGGPGSGLYRLRDTDGDDQFDKVEKLHDIPGGGEHGPHAVRLSPDGKSLYVAGGNHTHFPFTVQTNAPPQTMGGPRAEQLRVTLPDGAASRLPPNWDEDLLLPRQWDAGGHAVGVLAPGGWICQTDPDGKAWEVVSTGFRNEFDFAFNADGEMFAYDADMEWDFGSPWYRPTRLLHATSGSEFGWRSGSGKWPAYYVDSLPEVVNIGPGSPVGVEFGYGTKFPAKYQKAMFLCDWTFGTMYAVHLEPHGASYKGTKEEFVSRTPLPLTDCTVGKDGALYFTIGGRGAQSELFRVTYTGQESTTPVNASETRGADLRELRHKIEQTHKTPVQDKAVPSDISFLADSLRHADRFIRYAARVGLERQPVDLWKDRVLGSKDTNLVITGCAGLARQGDPSLLPAIIDALGKLDFAALTQEQQVESLRAWQLAFIRLGNPDADHIAMLAKKFDDLFPQKSDFVNRELSILMIHFQTVGAVKKLVPVLTQERIASQEQIGELLKRNKGYGGTIAAMLANQPDLQQYHYAFHLRNQKFGWTMNDRKSYFSWFDKARTWSGGASYIKFLNNIDKEAFESMPEPERILVEASGARKPYKAPELPKPVGPGKDYSLDELISLSSTKMKKRDFKNGQTMYAAARCVVCHRFGGDGGATGPDLTQAAGRFNFKDVAEAIVDPSKVVSDQYKTTQVETKDGKAYTGRIVAATNDSITLLIDPEDSTKLVTVRKDNIEAEQLSPVSLMPKDLLKQLNEDEVLDLMAYLLSRGNAKDAMFHK